MNPDANQPISTPPVAPSDPSTSSAPNDKIAVPTLAPKKPKTGLILGLCLGGALLVGIIVTILVLVLGGGVSKQDYRDAQNATTDLRTPYSKISSLYFSTYKTDTENKNQLDTLKKNRAIFNEDFEKLGGMKAIKNDKKAQELYTKASEQKTKLDAYIDAVVEAYEVLAPAAKEMENLSISNSADAIAALKSYQTTLKNLKVDQQVNKDYLDEINGILPDLVSAMEDYAKMDYTNYDSSLYTKVSNLVTKLTDADRSWKSNIDKLQEDAEFSDAYNGLGEYLTDKLNGK